jgi:hypothetical protein
MLPFTKRKPSFNNVEVYIRRINKSNSLANPIEFIGILSQTSEIVRRLWHIGEPERTHGYVLISDYQPG